MRSSFVFAAVAWATILLIARTGICDDRPNIVVFYTDDHGYADLSCQGVFDDVRTPNVDALAKSGVRALHGYSTAPQCVPSRAGLLVGKFQAKFGVESNGLPLDGFDAELTIAERLQSAGYITGQFGKWHLGAGPNITDHGFKYVYNQNAQRAFAANITTDGEDRPMGNLKPDMYHVDGCSHAAASIITRHKNEPLFLYVAYRAPHVPLDAPKKYLDRFPGEMPQRRRQALAMLSAVDDGVGLVMKALAQSDLIKKTLVFYIGDNGAPLKIHKLDAPGGGPGWDGSLNDPLNGEKGMLSEGGMHTPFVVSWPGRIPGGQEYRHPISALDVAATAAKVAKLETQPDDLDGVNLIPFLSGENKAAPHDALMWRWISQSAIREGDWKLLRGGEREYLYNLQSDLEEKNNVAAKHPEIADRLRQRLTQWSQTLSPPGLATANQAAVWNDYFDFYLDGKPAKPLRPKFVPKSESESANAHGPWLVRGGKLVEANGNLQIVSDGGGKNEGAALIRNGIKLDGPVTIEMTLKTDSKRPIGLAWRTRTDKTFTNENRIAIALEDTGQWQKITASIPENDKVIHVRFQMPVGTTEILSLRLRPSQGAAVKLPE